MRTVPYSYSLFDPELSNSPKTITEQQEYLLTSSDGKVTVVVNAKFGGSITKILDSVNWPGKNVVVDDHGGALMQSAFWFPEKANTFPEGCEVKEGTEGGDGSQVARKEGTVLR